MERALDAMLLTESRGACNARFHSKRAGVADVKLLRRGYEGEGKDIVRRLRDGPDYKREICGSFRGTPKAPRPVTTISTHAVE